MLALFGYPAALLIGISLGLIGAGGAILTIPVLVYLFDIPPHIATTYSLFVVGFSALTGSFGYIRNRLLCYETAFNFGFASLISVYITRRFIFPAIPESFDIEGILLSKDKLILYLFSAIMIFASYSMIRKQKVVTDKKSEMVKSYGKFLLILNGLIVGILAGLVGAGGGFLIIPALVLIQRLPMKMAVGTSLVIISANSFIGFAGDVGHVKIDWILLSSLCVLSLAGILIGLGLSNRISGAKLKPMFGWFILLMGLYIISNS